MTKKEVLERFAKKIETVKEPVRVYDTGQDVFGEFANGQEAAEAVRKSNPDWWAMAEEPTYEVLGE